jgi:hypothetical protein
MAHRDTGGQESGGAVSPVREVWLATMPWL